MTRNNHIFLPANGRSSFRMCSDVEENRESSGLGGRMPLLMTPKTPGPDGSEEESCPEKHPPPAIRSPRR
jgi:hypothetical protein